jgi:hypothetical protein
MQKLISVVLSALLSLFLYTSYGHAHGVIGKRFIPTTLVVDDPFVSDELDLLKVNKGSRNQDGAETSVGSAFAKRLTPDFDLEVGWQYLFQQPTNGPSTSGAGNPDFGFKYVLFRSPEHETILTTGFDAEVGGIGPARVAERISTFSPGFLFGKGLGDLPDSLKYLRPFSINGQLQVSIPSHRQTVTTSINDSGDIEQNVDHHPTTIPFGFAIMYSIPYLQSFVKDVGLTAPLANLFPVVEFNWEAPVSGPGPKLTTAFANPGVIWVGKYVELGLEAQVPMNKVSGKNAGINGLIHIFIDDLLPNIFTWTPGGILGPTPLPK